MEKNNLLKITEELFISYHGSDIGGYIYTMYEDKIPSIYVFDIDKYNHVININKLVDYLKEHYNNINIIQAKQEGSSDNNSIKLITFSMLVRSIKIYVTLSRWKRNYIYFYTKPLGSSDADLYNDLKSISKTILDNNQLYESNDDNDINIILNSGNDLYLESFPSNKIKKSDIVLSEHYNDDFLLIDEKIKKDLQVKNSNGIILLHGEPGVGKTYYIRHLVNQLNQLDFVFLPAEMSNILSDPSFLNFAINELQNCVLIIEDAEKQLESRETTSGQDMSVTNLLNVADGLISDILQLKVICTFNTELKHIDPAIKRKGRLIVEHEMKKLASDKSNNLLRKLNKNYETDKPMTLSEIYNEEENVHVSDENKNIGF